MPSLGRRRRRPALRTRSRSIFLSVGDVVERMRSAFLGETSDGDVLATQLQVSTFAARHGLTVPLEVPMRGNMCQLRRPGGNVARAVRSMFGQRRVVVPASPCAWRCRPALSTARAFASASRSPHAATRCASRCASPSAPAADRVTRSRAAPADGSPTPAPPPVGRRRLTGESGCS